MEEKEEEQAPPLSSSMAASSFSHGARVCDRRTRDQQDTSHVIFKVFGGGTWPVYVKGEVILKLHAHLTHGGAGRAPWRVPGLRS